MIAVIQLTAFKRVIRRNGPNHSFFFPFLSSQLYFKELYLSFKKASTRTEISVKMLVQEVENVANRICVWKNNSVCTGGECVLSFTHFFKHDFLGLNSPPPQIKISTQEKKKKSTKK